MKRTLAPILLLTLLFPSLAYALEMKDLVERDGLYYEKFTDVPFTGKTAGWDQRTFRNGVQHGPRIAYHGPGQLYAKGNYKDGKRDGPWIFYWMNGQLRMKGTFKDGKKDGPWVSHYDNGQLRDKENYKDGKANGSYVFYWKNGQLREKGTFKDGKMEGPSVFYNEDRTLNSALTGTYKNGLKVSD